MITQSARNGTSKNGSVAPVQPLRVGVIGCGYWGPQLIRNFYEMPDAELVGIAEARADRLDYARRHYPGVTLVTDYRQMLESDVQAVVVATPIQTHYAIAKDALSAGKHVLVEKPLASSVADAFMLTQLAREKQLTLMTGHTFLYNPAVQELRRIVQSGELGRIYYVDAARLSLGLFQRHVNVIWDLAPHDVSILFYVLDRIPVSVSARGSSFVQRGVTDVAYLEVIFDDGVAAQLHVSWLDPAKVRRITVVGDRKMAVYNDVSLAEKIRIYDKGVDSPVTDNFGEFQLSYRHGAITIPYIPWQEPLRLECEHFVECVQTGVAPRTDATQGLEVVAVLEAACLSLARGGVRVPLDVVRAGATNGHSGNGHQPSGASNDDLVAPSAPPIGSNGHHEAASSAASS